MILPLEDTGVNPLTESASKLDKLEAEIVSLQILPGPATEAEKVLSKFNSPQEAETIEIDDEFISGI